MVDPYAIVRRLTGHELISPKDACLLTEAVDNLIDEIKTGDARIAELEAENARLRELYAKEGAKAMQLSEALSRTGAVKVTDATIEAGLEYYAEGGCGGLADHERREVVEAIIEAAIKAAMDRAETAKAAAQAGFEHRILSALEPAAPEGKQTAAEAERARKGMDRILREQSERDIPFAPEDMANEPEASEIAKQKEGE